MAVRALRVTALVFALGVALAGCAMLPELGTQVASSPIPDDQLPVGQRVVTPPDQLRLHVFNSTTMPVMLEINGNDRQMQAQDGLELGIADLGPLPWHVVMRLPSGKMPIDVMINPGDDWRQHNADGSFELHPAGAHADLSCGQLRVTTELTPTPHPGPGSPGDCD